MGQLTLLNAVKYGVIGGRSWSRITPLSPGYPGHGGDAVGGTTSQNWARQVR